jgi:hypothetical protein
MRTDQLTGILENLFGELMHGVSGKGGFMLKPMITGLLLPGRPDTRSDLVERVLHNDDLGKAAGRRRPYVSVH